MPLNILYDKSAEITSDLPAATVAGLTALAYAYANAIKEALIQGYTSGEFVTGAAANSVTVSDTFAGDSGEPAISVGTDLMYPLYWELGFYSIFSRKFEHVEIWGPLRDQMAPELAEIFNETVLAYVNDAASA
jgi:hypothetical protein